MPSDSELTDREILERMRDHVNATQGGSANVTLPLVRSSRQFAFIADKGVPGYHLGRLRQDVEVVYQLQSAVGTVNPRPPGLANQVIQFSKRLLSRALSWYTRPLHQFQAAVARAFEEQLHALESLQNQVNTAATMNQQRAEAIEEDVQRLLHQNERFASIADRSDRLRRSGFTESKFQQFANSHLGSAQKRQRAYIAYFEGTNPVWDLAAGQGDFLQLLREHHIPAQGVETSADACRVCRDKDLQVMGGDLFDFLTNSADSSAGGIFAAGVIERLSAELQLHFIDLCCRKLKPGAPLLIEAINPECLFSLAKNFYLDPRNVRPVPHQYLSFILQAKGLRDVKIMFTEPVSGEYLEKPSWPSDPTQEGITTAITKLNRFAFGFQLYAAIAWRP